MPVITGINSNSTLYIRGKSALTGSCTLFLKNTGQGNQIPLTEWGKDKTNNNSPLYIGGKNSSLSNINLYTQGKFLLSGQTTLMTMAGVAKNGSPLFIYGKGKINSTPPLFVWGNANLNSNAPLYLLNKPFAPMNLFLCGKALGVINNHSPLLVAGSGNPSATMRTSLFIPGVMPSSTRRLPLFLLGSPIGRSVRNMNLYVGGSAPMIDRSTTLFLCNTKVGTNNSAPLFLQVDGTLLGGSALSHPMVLFLKRPTEAGMTMFLRGPGQVLPGSCPLYVTSIPTVNSFAALAMPKTVGAPYFSSVLYVNGW